MGAQARDQQRGILQVEGQVWRAQSIGRQATEVARERELEAEEVFGRGDARHVMRNNIATKKR